MQVSLIEKVVWITGASSGIGEALAYEFSRQGAKVILSARSEQELLRVKQNCSDYDDGVFVLPLDLSHIDALEGKTRQALEKWGGIDYLILNAGIAARDLVQNTGLAVYQTVMETNFFSSVALTKAVLPAMLAQHSGHLVVISSLSGKYGVPKLSAYAASKHALHGFFDSLRAEVSSTGIKVSIIIPGFINTMIIGKAVDGAGKPIDKNMKVNERGMAPEICAAKIVEAVKKQKQEVLIGGSEIYSVYLHRFLPNLFKSIIRNHPIKRIRTDLSGLLR